MPNEETPEKQLQIFVFHKPVKKYFSINKQCEKT